MWILLAMMFTTVEASCSDCCRSGGSCDQAYKGGPGVCCGASGECCPQGSVCVHCEYGRVHCAYPPYANCPRMRNVSEVESAFVAFMFGSCAMGFCLQAVRARTTNEIAPGGSVPVVVGHPTGGGGGDGFVTGLLGGMILSDVMHDADDPPTYVDATFSTDV